MIRPFTIMLGLVALTVAGAGCGSSDSRDKRSTTNGSTASGGQALPKGAKPAATAFTTCFARDGYTAKTAEPREESVFAAIAKSRGYVVAAINIKRDKSITPNAYLTFFDTPAEAMKAIKELKANTSSGKPPQQKGSVVIGYLDEPSTRDLDAAIARCAK